MTVVQLAQTMGLEVMSMPDPEKEIVGAYAGDLLSWVMGRAEQNCVWATIMTNVNVVAVASLADVGAVVVCENSDIPKDVVNTAADKRVNMLRSPLPMYEFCVALSNILK
jgi:hypothetical protein